MLMRLHNWVVSSADVNLCSQRQQSTTIACV